MTVIIVEVFHPRGAWRATYCQSGHLQRLRDEYKPKKRMSRTPCGGMNNVEAAMKSRTFHTLLVSPIAGLKVEQ